MVGAKMAEIKEKLKDPKTWIVIVLLASILILGNRLREYSYASVPNPGEALDEYSFGWLGLSLIQNKYPIAWSGISAYEKHDFRVINVDGLFDKDPSRPLLAIDKPWFDHPPAFGLVTGGYAYLKGVRNFADASVIILRRPMLKIAILTTVLIFILGSKLYGLWLGLFASLLYSTIPTVVISNRLALAENGYVPLFLGAVIFAYYYIEKKKYIYWIAACILAGIALLFKLSAIAIAVFLVLLSLLYGGAKKGKLVKVAVLSVVIPLGLFTLYGAIFDWNLFMRVALTNSQRFFGAGSEIFHSAVVRSTITKNLTDGWILLGWISLFIVSFREWKKEKSGTILVLACLSYFSIFLIFGSETYGWYRFPFYPFLVIASARVLINLLSSPNIFLFFALILLPMGTTIHRLVGVEGFQKYVPMVRILSLSTLVIIALGLIFKKDVLEFAKKVFIIILIALAIWLSVREIYFYSVENWYFVT